VLNMGNDLKRTTPLVAKCPDIWDRSGPWAWFVPGTRGFCTQTAGVTSTLSIEYGLAIV